MIGPLEPLENVMLVVIVADAPAGHLVVIPDEEHDDEAAVYMSHDPDIPGLVDALRDVYGPSARTMPVREYGALIEAENILIGHEAETDVDGLPDDLEAWAAGAEFTEDEDELPALGQPVRCPARHAVADSGGNADGPKQTPRAVRLS